MDADDLIKRLARIERRQDDIAAGLARLDAGLARLCDQMSKNTSGLYRLSLRQESLRNALRARPRDDDAD